eukprot:1494092-Rhodomonas_salina.1
MLLTRLARLAGWELGFTVFGEVVEGMSVVEEINKQPSAVCHGLGHELGHELGHGLGHGHGHGRDAMVTGTVRGGHAASHTGHGSGCRPLLLVAVGDEKMMECTQAKANGAMQFLADPVVRTPPIWLATPHSLARTAPIPCDF